MTYLQNILKWNTQSILITKINLLFIEVEVEYPKWMRLLTRPGSLNPDCLYAAKIF